MCQAAGMFVDPAPFDFIPALEANWTDIRDECVALASERFEPWVQREMYGEGWNVFGLLAFGRRIAPGIEACPKTAALTLSLPGVTTVGFSRLAAGAHIQPHVGWVKTVYRLHLGLVVPDGCTLRVGDETRAWREGECMIFDDTVEHEARNLSEKDRFVLLLDVLRPGVESSAADVPPPEVRAMLDRVSD